MEGGCSLRGPQTACSTLTRPYPGLFPVQTSQVPSPPEDSHSHAPLGTVTRTRLPVPTTVLRRQRSRVCRAIAWGCVECGLHSEGDGGPGGESQSRGVPPGCPCPRKVGMLIPDHAACQLKNFLAPKCLRGSFQIHNTSFYLISYSCPKSICINGFPHWNSPLNADITCPPVGGVSLGVSTAPDVMW